MAETSFVVDTDEFAMVDNPPPADHDEREEIREQSGSSAEVTLRAKQPGLMTRIGRGVKSAVGGAIGGAINIFASE